MFADLYSTASPQSPHLHLSRFFTLQNMIEKADATIPTQEVWDSLHTNSLTQQEKDNKPSRKHSKNTNTNTTKTLRTTPAQLSNAEKQEWSKTDNSREMMELLRTLTHETRSWFLNFLEEALESGLRGGCSSQEKKGKERVVEQNNHIAVTLSQLKQANEWLEKVRGSSGLEKGEVLERIDELKQKVYACLLLHIDSAASALDTRKSL